MQPTPPPTDAVPDQASPAPTPSGAPARPAVAPKPGNLLAIAILSLAAAVVGLAFFLLAGGDVVGNFLGLCCGVGGILLFAFSLVAYQSLRRRGALGPAAVPVRGAPMQDAWVCGACGADLRPDAKFCARCGEPVED